MSEAVCFIFGQDVRLFTQKKYQVHNRICIVHIIYVSGGLVPLCVCGAGVNYAINHQIPSLIVHVSVSMMAITIKGWEILV